MGFDYFSFASAEINLNPFGNFPNSISYEILFGSPSYLTHFFTFRYYFIVISRMISLSLARMSIAYKLSGFPIEYTNDLVGTI